MGGIHRKLTSLGHGLLLQKDCCCRSLQVDFLLAKCELFWILPVPPKWMNYNLKTIPTVLRKNIVKIFGIYRFLLANTTFQEQILVFYVYVKMERNSTARPSDVLHLRYFKHFMIVWYDKLTITYQLHSECGDVWGQGCGLSHPQHRVGSINTFRWLDRPSFKDLLCGTRQVFTVTFGQEETVENL